MKIMVTLIVWLLISWPAAAQTPIPDSAETQVNVSTSGFQAGLHVLRDDSSFIVVWSSGTLNTSEVMARLYHADGSPMTGEFQVNSYTTGRQGAPAVAAASDGSFIVAWSESDEGPPHNREVRARRFFSSGSPNGGDLQINSLTTNRQENPSIAFLPDDSFVVAFKSYYSAGTDNDFSSVQLRRFDSNAQPIGAEFQVNTYTTEFQSNPSVAVDSLGDFVVAWIDLPYYGKRLPTQDTAKDAAPPRGGPESRVMARRYSSDGTAIADPFQVSDVPAFPIKNQSLAIAPDDGFVVAWEAYDSPGTDTDGRSIQARMFESDGTPNGGQFQVNTYTTSWQMGADVAFHPSGSFLVLWESINYGVPNGPDGSSDAVRGQQFNADGLPIGGEFAVNSYTTGSQARPTLSIADDRQMRVTFRSYGSFGDDDDQSSVQMRTFSFSGGVGDRVWLDDNGNGIQDAGEPGASGVTVHLRSAADDSLLASAVTDADGAFQLWGPVGPPATGARYLEVELPEGRLFTALNQGAIAVDSDIDPATGTSSPFDLEVFGNDDSLDAGLIYDATVIFEDGFESGDTSRWSQP